MHISFYGTKKKHVTERNKDLTFKVSDHSSDFFKKLFRIRDQTSMSSIQRGGGEVFKTVMCFTNYIVFE